MTGLTLRHKIRHMEGPSANRIKKFLAGLRSYKNKKYVSCDMLSKKVSLYPDIIADELSYFDPMIRMDPSKNLLELVPDMEAYLDELEAERAKEPHPKRQVASKQEMDGYPNIASFVYDKMTGVGGLVDKSVTLDDHDLYVLKKLVDREMDRRKKKNSPKKKKKKK